MIEAEHAISGKRPLGLVAVEPFHLIPPRDSEKAKVAIAIQMKANGATRSRRRPRPDEAPNSSPRAAPSPAWAQSAVTISGSCEAVHPPPCRHRRRMALGNAVRGAR